MGLLNRNQPRGERWQGYLPVNGTQLSLPVTVIRGMADGETALITAGIHCREYAGIETAIRLASGLNPETLHGTVIVAAVCNPSGFQEKSPDLVPEDGCNLNRCFPGNSDGGISSRLAETLSCLLSEADYHIDLHCGGGDEDLFPHVYRQGAADPKTLAKSFEMGHYVNVLYMGHAKRAAGGFYNHAGALGIPGILIERGGRSLWAESEVGEYLHDVMNVLRYLEILRDGMEARRYAPTELLDLRYEAAQSSACWYPARRPGDLVRRGEVLGEVRTVFGVPLQCVEASASGVILYQTCSLAVRAGELLAAYGVLPDECVHAAKQRV